jgi:hypothetical protein
MGEVGGSQGAGRRHGKFRAREISSNPAKAAAGKKCGSPFARCGSRILSGRQIRQYPTPNPKSMKTIALMIVASLSAATDISASNGIIHVISNVLVP